MVQKRPFPAEDGRGGTDGSGSNGEKLPFQPLQRRRTLESQGSRNNENFLEALTQRLNEFVAKVREEVQPLVTLLEELKSFRDFVRPTPILQSRAETSGVKKFQLRFLNKVPKSIFTQTKIAAKDGSPIKVALFDIRSECVVEHGPLSCLNVDLSVLCGDFGSNDGESMWTDHEFLASVVSARPGKRPLLDGNPKVKLEGGIGEIGEIALTDNSKWMKNAMFKLGVMAVGNEEIQGGISDPFRVKDRRGESYEKHYPPLLGDPLWRLEKIAKDGPYDQQLSVGGIRTVEDLLRLHTIDPSALDKIFEGISKKKQESIMRHALTCVVDNSVSYFYEVPDPPIALLFNCIYKLVKVTFDHEHFLSQEDLTSEQKAMVEIVKQLAYGNLEDLVSVDQISSLRFLKPKELPLPQYSMIPGQDLQPILIPLNHYGMPHNLSHASSSTAYPFSESSLDGFLSGDISESFFIGLEPFARMNGMLPSCSQVPDMQLGSLLENSNQHNHLSNCFPATASASKGGDNSSHFPPLQAAEFNIFPSYPGANAHIMGTEELKFSWTAILAAVKWVRSVRRNEGSKAKLLRYNG